MKVLVLSAIVSFLSVNVLAADAPSIGGSAKISADVKGAVVNGGQAGGGAKLTLKQSVASVLHGNVAGQLKLSVAVKGAIVNAGASDGGATVDACQSVGSIGSDC